jgi:hypothetical protein
VPAAPPVPAPLLELATLPLDPAPLPELATLLLDPAPLPEAAPLPELATLLLDPAPLPEAAPLLELATLDPAPLPEAAPLLELATLPPTPAPPPDPAMLPPDPALPSTPASLPAPAQVAAKTRLVSIVTAPFRARALPDTVVLVFRVMLASARMLPANLVSVPRVAELPICQKTLHGWAPLITMTYAPLAAVSVLPIWKMKTAPGSPWASRTSVPVSWADDMKQ